MSAIKKIISGLDFSDTDKAVLSYLKGVNTYFRPESITFVNIHKEIELPTDIVSQFPDLKNSINDKFIKEMVEVSESFDIVGVEQSYLALEGDTDKELMKAAKNIDADILLVGKKETHDNVGISHNKLVRSSYCDVLIVPERGPRSITNVLVASDFSEYSKMALNKAIELAEQSKAKVTCQYVYQVPRGYSKTGKSYEEFAEIMLGHAKKDYEQFIASIDTKGVTIEPLFSLGEDNDFHKEIAKASNSNGVDLVVLGAKGRTNLAAIFIGSVTEKVLESNIKVPLYVVKKKGAEFGLFDAL